jgi:hypothetical protein
MKYEEPENKERPTGEAGFSFVCKKIITAIDNIVLNHYLTDNSFEDL